MSDRPRFSSATDERVLLTYHDASGSSRGMHLDAGDGTPLCGFRPQEGAAAGGRRKGHFEEFRPVGLGSIRETFGAYRERMTHVTVCGRCRNKSEKLAASS